MKKVDQKQTAVVPSAELVKPRRKFDAAFKQEAVALWLNSGKSAREISAQLGITQSHLYDWKGEYGPAAATETQPDQELERLRQENALLRQQRDILKKTLGIISEPPNNATSGSRP